MDKIFDIQKISAVLLKWKKTIIIVFISSTLISAIASSPLFIRPKFKSTTVLYPVNTKLYGTETPVEQMLQMLESNEIRESLTKKYSLLSHYDIDTIENEHYKTDVKKEFSSNISFSKTKYESVEIEVLDYSSDTAYLMSKDIIQLYSDKINKVNKLHLLELANTLKVQLEAKKEEMAKLDSTLKEMRMNYGILDYENQVRYLSSKEKITDKEVVGSMGVNTSSPSLIQNLREHGGRFIAQQNQLEHARSIFNDLKWELENVNKEIKRNIEYAQVVVYPEKADKKAYPVRWVIVALSVFSTMTLTLILVSFYEQNGVSKQNA